MFHPTPSVRSNCLNTLSTQEWDPRRLPCPSMKPPTEYLTRWIRFTSTILSQNYIDARGASVAQRTGQAYLELHAAVIHVVQY
jgi:hypothetical protein